MTKQIRVLMVDDEEQFRTTTARILNRRGFATTMAASGSEAIDILKQTPHDVVVLDIRMPGMDGIQALAEIRRIAAQTRVIMLTGHGAEASARTSLAEGAFDYLSKPCDIDLLAAKINDAFASSQTDGRPEEKSVADIMISVEDYTTIRPEQTIGEAIAQLKRSFQGLVASNRIMETGHRSILVFDHQNNLVGILSILDLIEALRPAYLSAPKPSMADSMQYSTLFWSGLFTSQAKTLTSKKVEDVMSETPVTIAAGANLMEVADLMVSQRVRRVGVVRDGKVIGVVREQELFFEIAGIIG
ncbi:MAG: response regulator [Desulfobacterales bacterium]|nr:response regulator [Desulfobacterales bacterium]